MFTLIVLEFRRIFRKDDGDISGLSGKGSHADAEKCIVCFVASSSSGKSPKFAHFPEFQFSEKSVLNYVLKVV